MSNDDGRDGSSDLEKIFPAPQPSPSSLIGLRPSPSRLPNLLIADLLVISSLFVIVRKTIPSIRPSWANRNAVVHWCSCSSRVMFFPSP